MLKFYKLSLLRLQMQSCHLPELSRKNKLKQYPASPTLLKSLNIQHDLYFQKRNELLSEKYHKRFEHPGLRPYQNQDVNFLMNLTNKAIFNEQRTGKTPTTIVTMKLLNQKKNIIIVPNSTTFVWEREWEKWHNTPCKIITSAIPKQKRKQIYKEYPYTIITTYGIINNDIQELTKYEYDAIVIDEAHRLRNFKGKNNKYSPKSITAIMELSKHTKARYALTGTPAPNYAYNIFPILHFLFPDLFTSYWSFLNYYFKTYECQYNSKGDTKLEISDFKPGKQQELLEFLELISIQRKRKDVMQWIPSIDYEEIYLEMSEKQKQMHTAIFEFFEYNDIIAKNPLDAMIKLRQISLSPLILGGNDKGPKIEYLLNFINDYPELSIIITSKFTSFLTIFANILTQKNILYNIITGSTSTKNRELLFKEFQEEKYKILLANLDVIKEGVTLDKANVLFITDQSLTYTDNDQLKDRIIPTTKEKALEKNTLKIIKLITKNSIEIYINKMLQQKENSSNIINNYIEILKKGNLTNANKNYT